MVAGFRPSEVRDLATIADAWGVGVATVAWALAVDGLARVRGRAALIGGSGDATALGAAAAMRCRLVSPAELEQLRGIRAELEALPAVVAALRGELEALRAELAAARGERWKG